MDGGELGNLQRVSDHDLRSGLREALKVGAQTEANIVAHLAAIESRRLYLEDGFSSMFKYCRRRYGMSEGEAYLRLNAVKLSRRFPIVFQKLVDRQIHLSALRLLRPHLTRKNHLELLECASGKSKLQILEMLATRFPRPGIDPSVRKLPTPRAELLPVSEGRYRLLLDVSHRFKEKLDSARALGSHANPSGDIERILEQALDLWLDNVKKRRFAQTTLAKKRSGPRIELSQARKARRRIARSTIREVTARDGMHCSYVSADGQRCGEQAFLQLHHGVPWARHGPDEATNLTWVCAAHNQYFAEKDFGQEHMARFKKDTTVDPDQVLVAYEQEQHPRRGEPSNDVARLKQGLRGG